MSAGTRLLLVCVTAALISVPAIPSAVSSVRQSTAVPDFDVRNGRPPVAPRGRPGTDPAEALRTRRVRLDPNTGAVRVLVTPGFAISPTTDARTARVLLIGQAHLLGLEPRDLASLMLVRDYGSRSNGVRHIIFRQHVANHPVFDSLVAVHVRDDGMVLRITSNAAPVDDQVAQPTVTPAAARAAAVTHTVPGDVTPASLVWLPVDGRLRLAWHVAVAAASASDVYDVLVDAHTADLLIRRNRVRDATGSGRVLQSTDSDDPRRPDATPLGSSSDTCPPPANYGLRSLHAPFRDPATVLGNLGTLDGNNARVFRTDGTSPSARGSFDGTNWLFDFPFNSAGSAETFLFFALNYAHDFFYDLGFDEAAGNFQVDNFGRGGVGGDPVKAHARAAGRNNANYVHAPDGSSPTINMFLWDGSGCWAEDVDGDGSLDLDGDYDLDIIVHEYHHGVSLRLNTAFTGTEAGAIGEGGGDFFAYSVNGDTTLASYSRPGGLRRINDKGYADWTCLLGLFCEVHVNGEIWANVLWEVRERFRMDSVGGSQATAVEESHQLYVDALSLSPPSPTMLDLRDAMLEADALRNAGDPTSHNFCRVWESFARRGMGRSATDTADNGLNKVVAAYDVPDGCDPPPLPPAPPVVSVSATTATGSEAGLAPAVFTFRRTEAAATPLTVRYLVGGSATAGADYVALTGSVTFLAGELTAEASVVPLDDPLVEPAESVVVSITAGTGYTVGAPASATVSIVSDDVAPDLTVPAVSAPAAAAPGAMIDVSDTTRNQGAGIAPPSQTSFYLSTNAILDAADLLLGTRAVPELTSGASSSASTAMTVPGTLASGTYFLFAKADGPNAVAETSEFNNTRTDTLAIGPDLVITTITAPATATAGGTIAVTETVANQGQGTAATSTTRFYLSSNAALDPLDVLLGARTVPELPQGAGSTASSTLTIPPGTPTGTYFLLAKADAAGLVAEANENNNHRSASLRIGPDLVVSLLSAPARAASRGSVAVTDTTRNNGAGSAAASTTAFYISANSVVDGSDVRLETVREVPALGPSEASTGTVTLLLPAVSPGTWYLLAHADDRKAVTETLETNNLRAAVLRIGPDLNFTGVSVPSTATAGASVNVTATLRNSGGETAAASTVHFYLSANTTLDAGDTQLGASWSVPVLAPDASQTTTISIPLPSDRTGTLYLLMVADAERLVAEVNENNNMAARLVQIRSGS